MYKNSRSLRRLEPAKTYLGGPEEWAIILMLNHSLGSKQKLVYATDPPNPVERHAKPVMIRPLAEDEKTDFIKFLLVGEKVAARMAVECSMSVHGDERIGFAAIAGEATRFGAMLSHFLARRGYDARLLCGSRETRAVALLRDKLERMDRMVARVAFLGALQKGVRRRVGSELARTQDESLKGILHDLLAGMDRRDRRTRRIRRMLSRSQPADVDELRLPDGQVDAWDMLAGNERWARVH